MVDGEAVIVVRRIGDVRESNQFCPKSISTCAKKRGKEMQRKENKTKEKKRKEKKRREKNDKKKRRNKGYRAKG